ncbi:MAG: hypothetical protein A2X36_06975 [Elusimicrobia bacterium GWA2_69_24]|nr:MAG: hypothetical protein A2X36_06975 [Elusimicrobia bacterium GWA2_69_24]HBL17827.1 hypothetical protein [Elusimicrobiota bacterium]
MRRRRQALALLLSLGLLCPSAAAQVRTAAVTQTAPVLVSGIVSAPLSAPVPLTLGTQSLSPSLAAPLPALSPALPAVSARALPQALALPASSLRAARPVRAIAPAAQAVPLPAAASFGRRIQALAAGIAEAGKALLAPASDGGRSAAETLFSRLLDADAAIPASSEDDLVLPVEGVDFSAEQLRRVSMTSAALERAVALAAGSALPGAVLQARSRGSSSRGTQSDENPDYDLMVRVDQGSPEAAAEAISGALPALKSALTAAVSREASQLFPGLELTVSVGNPVQLNDPADHKRVQGVFMLPVQVSGPSGLLIDADVSFSGRPEYSNDYPGYFDDQLAAVRRLGGEQAAARVLHDIRLAKKLFIALIGSYKPWRGGPSGVGAEQLIMQSGRVSDADRGRTVLEAGSFDKFMDRIHAAAYESDGRLRGAKKGRRFWLVHNAFMAPENFLDLVSDGTWNQLARAAKLYREARAEGRPVDLDSLKPEKPAPAMLRPVERVVPIVSTPAPVTPSLTMTSPLRIWKAKELVNGAVRRLKERGHAVEKSAVAWRRVNGENVYTVTLQLAPGGDAAKALRDLGELITREHPAARLEAGAQAPALKTADARLFLRSRSGRDAADRQAQKFARHMGLGRIELALRPGADGSYAAGFSLDGMTREKFAAAAIAFFKASDAVELAAVGFPNGAAPAASAAEAPGRLTLEMLNRFTTNGPAPSKRGDAYLYAQGAKALPAGLESSGRRTQVASDPGPMDGVTRTMLLRKNGRAYVMLEEDNGEGMPAHKPVKIPGRFAQGLMTQTLVEVVHEGKLIRSVRPIGAYAVDMMIGRVSKVGQGLRLAPLFSGDAAKALYEPLAIAGGGQGAAVLAGASRSPLAGEGGAAREGDILQVFVRPGQGAYEAVPLLSLGRELTPEIAAREIALRHGARGYFEEAVIRQAEEVGRTQDPAADFQRMKASKGRTEDLRQLPFVTIDPVGAGDLDDAYYVRKEADGSWTWYLATADVAQYVKPGTPAFKAAARIGNTFYSVDKDGVSEFPMNHPVVSKSVSSLLAGKDSLAMVSKMRFSAEGKFLLEESEVFLGLVRVQGRYTYDQVAALWKGKAGHGIAHLDQVALARELSRKLNTQDQDRGKLQLHFQEVEHRKGPDGRWGNFVVAEDPLIQESHRLIEELKVYGNRVIAVRLEAIADKAGIPHISRVHPAQDEKINERLRSELSGIGVPWPKDEPLWQYLARLRERTDLSPELRETAQILALRSRSSALYAADDAEGHEGLALVAKAYDHPSTPIRRFSDMFNRALLESYLEGGDPKALYEAVLADMKELGFESLEEYLLHLNGREQAARSMDREMDEFVSVYELAKPENRGRHFTGYVKMLKEGKNAEAVIQLRELPVTITLRGEDARRFKLLGKVAVELRGADTARMQIDASIHSLAD